MEPGGGRLDDPPTETRSRPTGLGPRLLKCTSVDGCLCDRFVDETLDCLFYFYYLTNKRLYLLVRGCKSR